MNTPETVECSTGPSTWVTALQRTECFAWYSRDRELADWAARHLLNRDDACVQYKSHNARDDGQKTFTSKRRVTREILVEHFRGSSVADLIGLHAFGIDGHSRWVAWDIDAHGIADPAANQRYAIHLYGKLTKLGFKPLLMDSDGGGGFHILVVFSHPIPSTTAHAFAKWAVLDHAEQGLKNAPETFPKQPNRDGITFGSCLRLPGRHHTRLNHWTRVYDGTAWQKGRDAIVLILATTGDEAALIPEGAAPPAPAPPPVAPAPERIVHINQAQRLKRAVSYISRMPDSRSGEGGHNALFAAARAGIQFGLDGEHLRLALAHFNNNKCHPKWSDADLLHKRQDAGKVFANEFGSKLIESDVVSDLQEQAKRCSDVGNSARFALRHGANVRYDPQRKQWFIFNGKRWEPDLTGRIVGYAKETVLAIYAEAQTDPDDAHRAVLAKHALASQKRERINAMLALAQNELAILAGQFDSDPMLINLQNGTFNVATGELQPHRREDFITRICLGAYNQTARGEVFRKFVAETFRSQPELVPWMQKAIGYAATGSVGEQAVFFPYGHGGNGKTTLFNAAMHSLGDYAGKAPEGILMARRDSQHPCEIAALVGKRLVVCSESREGARFDSARLKDLSGETSGTTRGIGQDFFDFRITFKLFLYSNHLPAVTDTSHGFWRRVKLIPFIDAVGENEKDQSLPQKLEAEVDAIVTWIVDGAVLWHREGLGTTPAIIAATKTYRDESDIVGGFLADRCEEGTGVDFRVDATPLYLTYVQHMRDIGEEPITQTRFGRALRERGFRSMKSGVVHWIGLKLKPRVFSNDGTSSSVVYR